MKDPLEDFIRDQREAFDMHEPPAKGWDNVSKALGFDTSKTTDGGWRTEYWWRVAAVFFMALSSYLFLQQDFVSREQSQSLEEFVDVEAFYVKEISNKVRLISEFNTYDEEEFTQNLQQLDAMYLVLKEEMNVTPSQKVKDALILNLMIRIDLLNKQLQGLEEKKEARATQSAT
jgi:hypothetical protein